MRFSFNYVKWVFRIRDHQRFVVFVVFVCVCVCDLTFEGECNVISHVTLEFSFTWFLLQRSVLLLMIYLKISL